jgi:copper chaperone CopZ
MKNKALNTCLVLAAVVILIVFGVYVRIGASADSVVVLKTSGMTCGSCIAKVTKALQSERGVASTEVDLEGGVVIAGYDSKQVAPGKLAQAVGASGFGCQVQSVLTPEQFKKLVGREVGRQASGCCGNKGCCGAQAKKEQ